MVALCSNCFLNRGSIKSQIGQSEIFHNWRWTLVFIIWGGLVIGGRDCIYLYIYIFVAYVFIGRFWLCDKLELSQRVRGLSFCCDLGM